MVPVMLLEELGLSVRLPGPDLVNPTVPARGSEMVTPLPVPRAFTVINGVPPRVSVLPPSTSQPAAEDVLVSPKSKFPRVLSVSSVTVLSAVMSIVLKSAVLPLASATVPPDQLEVSLQLPLASAVHVPLCAMAAWDPRSAVQPERILMNRCACFFDFMGLVWFCCLLSVGLGYCDSLGVPCEGYFVRMTAYPVFWDRLIARKLLLK